MIVATAPAAGLILGATWLAGALAPLPALAQPTCEAVRVNGVKGCHEERVALRRVMWNGKGYLVSPPITANPERLYWACCARDAAGNPSNRIQQGGVLAVFLGEPAEGISTWAEDCAKPIVGDASEEWEMLWLSKGGRLFVVAPAVIG
jgi:hypothetical protein